MCGLIAMDTGLRRRRGIYVRGRGVSMEDILCRPEELRGFKEHLDDVLVAVPLGSDLGIQVEKEDVHLDVTVVAAAAAPSSFRGPQKGDAARNCTSYTRGSATGNSSTIAYD